MKKLLKSKLIASLLAFVVGIGVAVPVTKHVSKVTSDAYAQCMADPKVQLVGQAEMFVKVFGSSLADLRSQVAEIEQTDPQLAKLANEALDFYQKHEKVKNGVTMEAFVECLNK